MDCARRICHSNRIHCVKRADDGHNHWHTVWIADSETVGYGSPAVRVFRHSLPQLHGRLFETYNERDMVVCRRYTHSPDTSCARAGAMPYDCRNTIRHTTLQADESRTVPVWQNSRPPLIKQLRPGACDTQTSGAQ